MQGSGALELSGAQWELSELTSELLDPACQDSVGTKLFFASNPHSSLDMLLVSCFARQS